MLVRDWMVRDVVTVTPRTSLLNARRLMDAYGVRHLPVVEEGRLVGIISIVDCLEGLAAEVRSTQAALAADEAPQPTEEALPPIPEGDGRPGRSAQRPRALVVHWDVHRRMETSEELILRGYEVVSCPGPLTEPWCAAVRAPDGPKCPRIPERISLVVLDAASAASGLADVYPGWLPEAELEVAQVDEASPAGRP